MGVDIKATWFLLFNICFLVINLSEARHGKKLPSALVVGTVHCDTCSEQVFSKTNHFISGASVAVICGHEALKTSFYQEVKTDKHGEFQVYLPTRVSKQLKSINGCSVKLVHSGDSSCSVASLATSSSFCLKAAKEGTHIFSAGVLTFKPLKQKGFCNQHVSHLPTLHTVQKTDVPTIPTLPTAPTTPTLPTPVTPIPQPAPVPDLPLPPAPGVPMPPVPDLPMPPVPAIPMPPAPGLPTPTVPGLPTPTVPGLPKPPVPAIPMPPAPGLPMPPVPGLPTPTVPGLPMPPVPAVPGAPGIPPAFSTKKKSSP